MAIAYGVFIVVQNTNLYGLCGSAKFSLKDFLFEIDFVPDYLPVALAFVLVSGLTMAVGALSSRGIHSSPPLEVLRSVG